MGGRRARPIGPPAAGDLVALHWDWVCAVLAPPQVDAVRHREAAAMCAAGLT